MRISGETLSLNGWVTCLQPLSWDSDFFGLRMARLEPFIAPSSFDDADFLDGSHFAKLCLNQAELAGIQHLSAQVHCKDICSQYSLQSNGFFLADTIIEFRLALIDFVSSPAKSGVVVADFSHREALMAIAAECFGNPSLNSNRFNADRSFANNLVRKMYSTWVSKSLDGELADQVFVFIEQSEPVGFITINLPTNLQPKTGRVSLNAVHPQFQGRGIYGKLVDAACAWLKAEDVAFVEIKTQLPNLPVHRAWTNRGAHPSRVMHTFHRHCF